MKHLKHRSSTRRTALAGLLLLSGWGLFHGLLAGAAVDPDDLLDPDVAFALEVAAPSRARLAVTWQVAPGYYLYQHRIRFSSATPGVTLGAPEMPPGKAYHDEFFGDVVTYRGAVTVNVPLAVDPALDHFELTAESQGCADLGVCYPPHRQVVAVTLPAAAGAPAGGLDAALAALGGPPAAEIAGAVDGEALPEAQAFQVEAIALDGRRLLARLTPAPGYYLYRDKISFASLDPAIAIAAAELPPGEKHADEFFGAVEIYRTQIEVPIDLRRSTDAAATFDLQVALQGCKEQGICYPPMQRRLAVALPADGAAPVAASPASASGSPSDAAANTVPAGGPPLAEQDRLAQRLAEQPLWLSMLLFAVFGIGLAFTPCVFPMIPILSGIIAGEGANVTRSMAFTLSLAYVLAMALTYTAVGVIAAQLGYNLQAVFQNPWVLTSFALVFVLLALAMFGFYNLQLPAAWQAKLTALSNRQGGGKFLGAAIMGFFSALIVGPCVTAPLIGILIFIAQTGDTVLGGSVLFALSIGMGLPLLAIGVGLGHWLPRAGAWMDGVKAFFGVTLLGLALWMLERIVPGEWIMLGWGLLLIASGVYLGALARLGAEAGGWARLRQSLGFALLLFGSLEIVGFGLGGDDWMQPLERFGRGGGAAPAATVEFTRIRSVDDLDRELERGQVVMLDFYADWCVECKRMEKYTFPKATVAPQLGALSLLQADVTANDEIDQALLRRFGLIGPPAILFFDRSGKEMRAFRVIGFMNENEFANHLERLLRET